MTCAFIVFDKNWEKKCCLVQFSLLVMFYFSEILNIS